MEFKDILRGLREDKDLKQREVAEILGVSRRTYTSYENGTYEPSIQSLIKLANFFGTTIDYLVGRVNTKH